MKTKYLFSSCLIIMVVLLLTGCDNNEKNKAENAKEIIKADLQKAKADFESDWVTFKNDVELKMESNQAKIDSLKLMIKKASKKVKTGYENQVETIEQNNILLKKDLAEYKFEGKENWEKFKLQLNYKLDVVGKSINDFFADK
ncbi:MAG: hypothetical protein V1773_15690 [bacterium]